MIYQFHCFVCSVLLRRSCERRRERKGGGGGKRGVGVKEAEGKTEMRDR